ncbi:hypothetical protein [Chloroflexus sp.]|uniref:hypothetical protein n=1 Tax=Chloroflexus sp. TaxID=1904827 RepID=UPI00298ED96D|nr:hypothetical protein [Chloroflexus sp.]MDW8403827.1 hypothetical protein [Chloroflexus sp.]
MKLTLPPSSNEFMSLWSRNRRYTSHDWHWFMRVVYRCLAISASDAGSISFLLLVPDFAVLGLMPAMILLGATSLLLGHNSLRSSVQSSWEGAIHLHADNARCQLCSGA